MEKVKTFDLVKSILENDPNTRDDDFELIWYVAREFELTRCTFTNTIVEWRKRKLPSFEAITRARRKVQELNPSLRATERVAEIRAEQETEYHDFYSACK